MRHETKGHYFFTILQAKRARRSVAVGVVLVGVIGASLGMGVGVASAAGQEAGAPNRPIPGPLVAPSFFRDAIDSRTRSAEGSPGRDYWQNHASYQIAATLDPVTGWVEGEELIVYENRSPEALPLVVLNLYQNIHVEGAARSEPLEITGGIILGGVEIDGVPVETRVQGRGAGYQVEGTVMVIRLPDVLEPGGSVEISLDWRVLLPQNGAGRMGHSEREMYFVAYWFPKMAVFDDLRGWDAEDYLGGAEFYDGFGDYDVTLRVPEGWTAMGTGTLMNPDEVLTEQVRNGLQVAATSDTIVHLITRADRRNGVATPSAASPEGLEYRFTASNVRDFTWTASNVQLWDATSAVVSDRDLDGAPDRVLIHSFWRDDRAPKWASQALYGKHAIEHHSEFTGMAYPWPHMTSVEGADIIGGGMEFPMLTLIGPYNSGSAEDLYNVTAHELAHMWVPMIVGSNERRYAWMDEGSTTFLEDQSRPHYWPGVNADSIESANYVQVAALGLEGAIMTHGDYYEPGPGYGTASYPKPATVLVMLRDMLGEEVFLEGYRSFLAEWSHKHPSPWDLFNTFERVSGKDLDWFWQSWYFETWVLDHAVQDVRPSGSGSGAVVVIADLGWVPMPVDVRIWTQRGGAIDMQIPVEEWLGGKTEVELEVAASAGEVLRVQVDPERLLPDAHPENNGWRRR